MTSYGKSLFLLICVISSASLAQEFSSEGESDADRYAECAAYFELAYHALSASEETETAALYYQLQQRANLFSLLLAQQGRDPDLASEVTNSRIEMHLEKMRREANNQAENLSILINKYHFTCSDLIESPTPSVREILSEFDSDEDQ